MARPLIFLDVDGVLNNTGCWGDGKPGGLRRFDPDCCRRLGEVCAATGSLIVVSSTWRVYGGCRWLQKLFRERGAAGVRVIGRTPLDEPGADVRRGAQIVAWLAAHGGVRGPVAAVDDDDDGITAAGVPLVLTTFRYGLSARKAAELVRVLGRKATVARA